MYKKIILSGLMCLTLALGTLQVMATIGGDCTAQQISCCPVQRAELIHCQNMWNNEVYCAYDDDSVIDVTACAGTGGGGGGGGSDTEDKPCCD